MASAGSGSSSVLEGELRRHPAILLAVLFGSSARGVPSRNSDIDLGILLSEDGADERSGIEAALCRAAGRPVDLIFLEEAPPLLRFEVARDGKVLLERRPFLWADFKARAMIDWWDWAPTARRIVSIINSRLRETVARGQA